MRRARILALVTLLGCQSTPTPDVEVVPCPQETACPTGEFAGTIRGDMDPDVLELSGSEPSWIHVDVLEANSTLSPAPMRVVATLTSPPGARYELTVNANTTSYSADGGPVEPDGGLLLSCEPLAGAGPGERIEIVWGETDPDSWPNGVEDGRRLAFEVRQLEGPCPVDGSWQLRIQGG